MQVIWLLALAIQLLQCGTAAPSKDKVFRYRSYRETNNFFEELQRKYPDLVEVWYAQEIFPEINPQKSSWATCEGEPCKTLIVRIANKRLLTNSTPEVFFSGALHGDERVGPLTVTELAAFLCEEYDGDQEVRRLVDLRATWIMPMTNAHGYALRRREENSMDPNRDFPYLQRPEFCMRTQTARAVNELFRRHLFQFMITFHGGMRALTYEWGSRNHMKNRRSTESPDNAAFREVGEAIQAAAGKTLTQRWFYPLGPINDLVYPVDGGMEDWSYAAGWEPSPQPISVCRPTTYGGYAEDRTKYRRDSISTLVYLAEMDDFKTAPDNSLGHRLEIRSKGATQGHVPRNLRMCLKVIELARPEVVVVPPSLPTSIGFGSAVSIQVYGFGCHTMNVRLIAVSSSLMPGCAISEDGATLPNEQFEQILQSSAIASSATACRGLSLWAAPEATTSTLRGGLGASTGEVCLLVAAEFDAQWAKQQRPDPQIKPRSHAARIRLDSRYDVKASDGPMMIQTRRTKLFVVAGPIQIQAIQEAAAATAATPQQEAAGQKAATVATVPPANEPPQPPQPPPNAVQAATDPSTASSAKSKFWPPQPETEDFASSEQLLSVALISLIASLAVGCSLLACNQREPMGLRQVTTKADTKDAQYISELAEMVGKPP